MLLKVVKNTVQDGKGVYREGDTFEADKAEAERLIDEGVAVEAEKPKGK